ncbi:hypothetical protein ACFV1L_08340 [Kitasatospora sp. NPDC059646]|uniref:hypothetical protein n=1 Tax=Kitasatospora sp. NPDC059646 TaxID=3346893 RepID=UPI003686926B
MVWAKVDRELWSAKDCADVAHWAEENHKVLIITDDGITPDHLKGQESSFGSELAKVFLMRLRSERTCEAITAHAASRSGLRVRPQKYAPGPWTCQPMNGADARSQPAPDCHMRMIPFPP